MTPKSLVGAPARVSATNDGAGEAISFPTAQGALVLEISREQLFELLLVTVQCLEVSSGGLDEAQTLPTLPVQQWETGVTAHEQVALRLRVVGGGEIVFKLGRALATSLQAGLGDAVASLASSGGKAH